MTPQPEPAKPAAGTVENPHTREGYLLNDEEVRLKFKEIVERNNKYFDEIASLRDTIDELRAKIIDLKGGNGCTREALQQAEAECVSLRKTIEELVAAGNRCIFRENVYGLAKDVEHWRVAVEKATKGKL